MERRKLFSKVVPTPRRKLFSVSEVEIAAVPEQPIVREVVCMDCGYRMETSEESSVMYCPKCGGKRFQDVSQMSVEKEFSRRKLFSDVNSDAEFQKMFSNTEDPFELKLKEFSGKTLSVGLFEKEFSDHITLDELQELGYGENVDGKVKIFSDAFNQERLFSCIRMTISKTLELDPAMLSSAISEKRDIVNSLASEDKLCPKTIMLIKKAHNIPVDSDNNEWMKDSGICNDLGLEFGGSKQGVLEFKKILDERYPDAPENIIDLLKNHGAIKVEGDQVEFIK